MKRTLHTVEILDAVNVLGRGTALIVNWRPHLSCGLTVWLRGPNQCTPERSRVSGVEVRNLGGKTPERMSVIIPPREDPSSLVGGTLSWDADID